MNVMLQATSRGDHFQFDLIFIKKITKLVQTDQF
jgi:hypothetical protein